MNAPYCCNFRSYDICSKEINSGLHSIVLLNLILLAGVGLGSWLLRLENFELFRLEETINRNVPFDMSKTIDWLKFVNLEERFIALT